MPSLDDMNKQLDQASEGTQPWKATKEGDQVAGRVTKVGSFTHPEYGTSPTTNLDTSAEEAGAVIMDGKVVKDPGPLRVLWAGAVLGSSFDEDEVAAGDWVAIRYLGKKKPASGSNAYNNYAVIVEKATASSKLDDVENDFA